MRAKILSLAFWSLFSFVIAYYFGFRYDQDFYIKQKTGALGCVSRRYYMEMMKNFQEKRPELVRKMINDHKCFFFKTGEKVEGKKKYCQEGDNPNKVEIYATDRFIFGRIWLPCFVFAEGK